MRLNEAGYRPIGVRIELIGIIRQFAMIDLKPLEEKAPAAPVRKENFGTQVPVLELNVPDKARQEFELGQKSREARELDEGIVHLQKALSIYDSFPQAHLLLGSAYLEQKKWTEAQTSLETAIRLNPKLAEAYLELGAVLNQLREYPKAETALMRGLDLNPDSPMGHYELAKAQWASGRWQDAAPHAATAVAAMPDLAAAHVLLGNILLRKQDLDAALREYQTYLRLEPNGSMAAGTRDIVEKIKASRKKWTLRSRSGSSLIARWGACRRLPERTFGDIPASPLRIVGCEFRRYCYATRIDYAPYRGCVYCHVQPMGA